MITLSATTAKQTFGSCLMNVAGSPIIIEKSGSPAAVMISYEEFLRLTDIENKILLARALDAEKEGFLTDEESTTWFTTMNERFSNVSGS